MEFLCWNSNWIQRRREGKKGSNHRVVLSNADGLLNWSNSKFFHIIDSWTSELNKCYIIKEEMVESTLWLLDSWHPVQIKLEIKYSLTYLNIPSQIKVHRGFSESKTIGYVCFKNFEGSAAQDSSDFCWRYNTNPSQCCRASIGATNWVYTSCAEHQR